MDDYNNNLIQLSLISRKGKYELRHSRDLLTELLEIEKIPGLPERIAAYRAWEEKFRKHAYEYRLKAPSL